MRCGALRLRNFKNITTETILWGEGLNLLVGKNGAGKTNCLEALHLLLGWGPLGDRKDIASWGSAEKKTYVTGDFFGEEEAFLAVGIGGSTVVKYNGKRCSFPEVRSVAPSLAFLPSDMELLDGSPARRRSFLDRLCALLWPLYARRLVEFRRAVRHRIVLLRQGGNLVALSKAMAPLASWLWGARASAVSALAEGLAALPDLLPLPVRLAHVRGGAGRVKDPLEDWWESLEARREKERLCCSPLVGPHRDDLEVCCGERSAASCLSRGQKRRASAALMIAAGRCVERRLRRSPILLLDEIASELDAAGREVTVETLRSTGWQVVATAAGEVVPDWPGLTLRVEGGAVFPCT